MKFFKRYWFILIILVIGLCAIVIPPLVIPNTDYNYFMYVKDNKLVLWDKDEKKSAIISDNFSGDGVDGLYQVSGDYRKIVFSDNVIDSTYDLKYSKISKVFKDGTSSLIASNVTSSAITKKGIVYIKDDNLYYNDYVNEIKIFDNVIKYVISNKNVIYYTDHNNDLYEYNLKNNTNNKLNSNVIEIIIEGNNILYYKDNGSSDSYDLYLNDTLISNNVYEYLGLCNDEFYFLKSEMTSKFDGENVLDLFKSLKTYKYSKNKATKVFDGILEFDGFNNKYGVVINFDDVSSENIDESNIVPNVYLNDIKKNDKILLGNAEKFNIIHIDYNNNYIYYNDGETYYRSTVKNNKLIDNIELGKSISLVKNDEIEYFYDNYDGIVGNLREIKDNKNILIGENVTNVVFADKVYYTSQNNLYSYSKKSKLILSNVDDVIDTRNTLFICQNTKDNKCDLSVMINNKIKKLDSDVSITSLVWEVK